MFLICVYHFMLSYLWFFGRAPFTIQLIKINRNLNNRSTKKIMWLVELCMHYIPISHSDSWFNCTNHLSIRWLIKIGDRVIRRTPCSIRIRAMTDIWVTQTNSVWNKRGSNERKREAQRIWTSALRAGKESERARLMCVVCVCVLVLLGRAHILLMVLHVNLTCHSLSFRNGRIQLQCRWRRHVWVKTVAHIGTADCGDMMSRHYFVQLIWYFQMLQGTRCIYESIWFCRQFSLHWNANIMNHQFRHPIKYITVLHLRRTHTHIPHTHSICTANQLIDISRRTGRTPTSHSHFSLRAKNFFRV